MTIPGNTRLFFCIAALWLPSDAFADILEWNAFTIPPSGYIQGAAGSTIGWGYSITNSDPSLWLLLDTLDASPFLHATAFSVFDFPAVAPLSTIALGFDGVNGLYGLTWDADAPLLFENTGIFTLGATWYDGDPFGGGVPVAPASAIDLPYVAQVVAPEPATFYLVAGVLLCLAGVRRRALGARSAYGGLGACGGCAQASEPRLRPAHDLIGCQSTMRGNWSRDGH